MAQGANRPATDPSSARRAGFRRLAVRRDIPQAAVARMPEYLRALSNYDAARSVTISSEELAALVGVSPAKIRKDLSYIGSHGRRGVGYQVSTLLTALQQTLGVGQEYPVAVVGAGHLGSALAGYAGFTGRGFPIRAIFDIDPTKIGTTVAGVSVADLRDAQDVCAAEHIAIGVIATPEIAAQQVADVLVKAGVRSLLNFSPGHLSLPPEVEMRHVDLALELHMLAFHESGRLEPSPPVGARQHEMTTDSQMSQPVAATSHKAVRSS